MRATYDPADDKLRIYSETRLSPETYAKVKGTGYGWAPKQGCFFAVWSPEREDLAIELAGEISDEDTSLVERAEARADRFENYQEKRAAESARATEAVNNIADGIPLGQPILVGHHSERRARRDAERIENGMKKAVNLWKTAEYWSRRAAGVLKHAERKERPDVVARRIKTLEAAERKHAKELAGSEKFVKAWNRLDDPTFLKLKATGAPTTPLQKAVYLADCDWQVARMSVSDIRDAKITPEQARDKALAAHEPIVAHHGRWLEHTRNRLAYERTLLADAGGLPADKTKPETGGAIRCWCCKHPGMWMLIQKVNKVSVTVSDTWGHGDLFPRKIKLDEITGVMGAAEVAAKLADGTAIKSDDGRCIVLQDPAPKTPPRPSVQNQIEGLPANLPPGNYTVDVVAVTETPDCLTVHSRFRGPTPPPSIAAMESSLKAGVQAVSAPNLFVTPPALAVRMVKLANVSATDWVLEPSAGTGIIAEALAAAAGHPFVQVVEINTALRERLQMQGFDVAGSDFLAMAPPDDPLSPQRYTAIVMNPPFDHGTDIEHILHALKFLRPGGVLVGICADGSRQRIEVKQKAEYWEELPPGTFAGTNVRAALFVIRR